MNLLNPYAKKRQMGERGKTKDALGGERGEVRPDEQRSRSRQAQKAAGKKKTARVPLAAQPEVLTGAKSQ